MRIIALRHTGSGLALRILHQKTALRALHEHDEGDDNNNHDDEGQNNESGQRALTAKFNVPANALGNSATIPAKIMSEMPLPTPREVTCSPSHIKKTVPPTSVTTALARKKKPGSTTTPCAPSRPMAMP